MFSLGCSCGRAESQLKIPQHQGDCFSYVVSIDGVHICHPTTTIEYEDIGEEEPESNSQALVEYESIGDEEPESISQALVKYENTANEKPESISQPLVKCENIAGEEPDSISQALIKHESTKAAVPKGECPCSLLQRRGRSLSKMHLALLTSTGSTLVNLSGDRLGERNVADGPRSGSGNYDFIKQIGIDGEGVIDLMRSRSVSQLVVRKTVEYARLAYAKPIEAAVLQDILPERHPNIIKLHAFESYQLEGARYYFEYCSGGDLHELVNQYRKRRMLLPEPFIWQTYQKLASALEFLHQGFDPRCPDPTRRGICHRDIKPSNVFLRLRPDFEYPDVVLADFGHATLDFATYDPAGTTVWQPPELPRHSPKGDVYSLGAVIHFMVHCEAPIVEMPDGLANTQDVRDAFFAAPETRRPILDFVHGYSEELVCMMLMALEPDEKKRKNASQLFKYVSDVIEMKFPSGSDSLREAAEDWPMARWAFDGILSPRGRCEEEEEEDEIGAEQYFDMMDRFGYCTSRESSNSSSYSARSDQLKGVDRWSSRGCEMSSLPSLGETY